MRGLHPAEDSDAWRGMEMFMAHQVAADDPRLAAVYDNFRRNLNDICGIARRTGAAVILSTVAVNLADCPPFASRHRSDLSAEDLAKWKTVYQAGIELETRKQWSEAIAKYEVAAQLDDHFADLEFRMGRCLAASGRLKEAGKCFASARDLDVLRFRADSQINAAIRAVAAEQEGSGVRFADAEHALAASEMSPGGIPGGKLFYEHVHLTFDGNYLLAHGMLDQVDAALPQLAASRKPGPVLTRRQCADALTLTPWDEAKLSLQMTEETSRPPFTNQLYHAADLAAKRERVDQLLALASTPRALQDACRSYEAALEKSSRDWQLHFRYGNLELADGRPKIAAEHLRTALDLYPWETLIYINLGNAERQSGRFEEAIAIYRKALEIEPGSAMAHYNLALTFLNCRRYQDAIGEFRKSLSIDPGSLMGRYYLAVALGKCDRIDEAIAQYEKALEIDPQFVMAHYNLGMLLEHRGRKEEASVHAQKALEIETGNAAVHVNLGLALAGNGETDKALDQYRKALKIDPQCAMAHLNLGIASYDRGQIDEAIVHYQKALEADPRYAMAHYHLGIALADRGKIDQAITEFQNTLQSDPRNAAACFHLGKALALRGRSEEAIACFQRAIRIKPDYSDARRELDAAFAERDRGSAGK